MLPWDKEQFWAIMYNTDSDAKQEEYAKEQGMSESEAKEVAKEVPNN